MNTINPSGDASYLILCPVREPHYRKIGREECDFSGSGHYERITTNMP
jgi:hypothetical protein